MNLSDPEVKKELIAAYPTSTLKQLSLQTGKSVETIRQFLKKNGVQIRKQGVGPTYTGRPPLAVTLPSGYTEKDVVVALLKGTPLPDIAKFLKMKRSVIERIARHNGLVLVRGEWRRG